MAGKRSVPWARKADREAATVQLLNLAAELGLTVEQRHGHRDTNMVLACGGLGCQIWLNGESGHDATVASWHSKDRLPEGFGSEARAEVNRYHGCKATSVEYSWRAMLAAVRCGFTFYQAHLEAANGR